jgi:hypothetical protein
LRQRELAIYALLRDNPALREFIPVCIFTVIYRIGLSPMNITYRSFDFADAKAKPDRILQADGPVTLVTGTGAFVPISVLRDLLQSGAAEEWLAWLQHVNEALADQEAEEDMVSAWPEDTGVDHALKILPRAGARHGPRIKVAINPPDRFSEGGTYATIPFGETSIASPVPNIVPPQLLRQLHEYIALNREPLIAFYNERISGIQLAAQLRKISR